MRRKIMKPFVVCHMMSSLDGRIDCAMTEYLGSKTYYAVLDELACRHDGRR